MALPYLLDSFQIPKDLFQLYMVAGIINGRFGTLLAAMDLIAFTLICTGSLIGLVKFRLRRMVVYSSLMLGISILVIVMLKLTLNYTFKNDYKENKILESMVIRDQAPAKVWKDLQSTGMIKEALSKSPTLARIMKRKLIRIGYNPDTIPFSYFNGKGELVGYDIAMAHHLAIALKCKLEFYPVEYKDVNKQLDSGNIDIAMSGLNISIQELTKVDFTRPYMTMTMAFVVKSYHKGNFESQTALAKNKNLRIATIWNSSVVPMIKKYLPHAKIEVIKNNQDFFTGKVKADALLISAEAGSAWTLKYPAYSVAIPQPLLYKTEAAYAVAKNNPDLLIFLSQWIALAQLNGVIEKEYNYWILGLDKDNKKPRWSIKKNVLGWD
jgi:ABC-type amino acid transport substrate-binding protein